MQNKILLAITSYNRPQKIKELLKCLSYQTDKNFNIYILNDGNNKKTQKIIEQCKVNFNNLNTFQTSNPSGLPKARNLLLNKISLRYKNTLNTYIAFLDDDLIVQNDFIEQIKISSNKYNGFTFRMIQKGSSSIFDFNHNPILQKIFTPFIGSLFPSLGLFFGGFYIKTDRPKPIKHIVGACLIYNYSKNPQLRFDENLNKNNFLCEDTCFSYELYLNGNKLFYIPNYTYIHNPGSKGGSNTGNKLDKFGYYFEHKLYVIKKFHSFKYYICLFFCFLESLIYTILFRKNIVSKYLESMSKSYKLV